MVTRPPVRRARSALDGGRSHANGIHLLVAAVAVADPGRAHQRVSARLRGQRLAARRQSHPAGRFRRTRELRVRSVRPVVLGSPRGSRSSSSWRRCSAAGPSGILLALVLRVRFPGRSVFRVLLLLPWIVPIVVTSTSWAFLLGTSDGRFPRCSGHSGSATTCCSSAIRCWRRSRSACSRSGSASRSRCS